MTGPEDAVGGLRALPIAQDIQIKLVEFNAEIDASLQSHVDEIWQLATQNGDSQLFDGTLMSVLTATPQYVEVYQTQYRYFYAQSQDAELFQSLNIRPLACSGILLSPDGLVFARRGSNVFLDTNKWELAPSGTLDGDGIGHDGTINVRNFLLRETNEELGIETSTVRIEGIIGLYENLGRHNIDIVIRMNVDLNAAEIHALFKNTTNDEYDSVEIVSIERLAAFIAQHENNFVSLSRQILRQHFDQ